MATRKIISLQIDVNKIDKNRLYKGKKGTYLNAVLFLNDETDEYGNHGFVTESVSKEEREAGTRGAILGNAKELGKPKEESSDTGIDFDDTDEDSLPF